MKTTSAYPVLNVAAEVPSSSVNGPGSRYVVWLQGCPFRCLGCFNRKFQSFTPKYFVEIDTLAERILAVDGIEGTTFSGGEPMLQSSCLLLLARILRKNGHSIFCYTGYTLEELHALHNQSILDFLKTIDILVDGRFVAAKKANLLWRGSSNQKIHFLTNRYTAISEQLMSRNKSREIEIIIGENNLTFTGIFEEELIKKFSSAIRSEKLSINDTNRNERAL